MNRSPLVSRSPLNAVLLFDAATCLLMGVALLALADVVTTVLGLSAGLLRWAGALLLPCAVLMAIAGFKVPVPRALVLVLPIVAGNLAWVVASVYVTVAVAGITLLGQAAVAAQAFVVLVLAILEWRALAALGERGNLGAAA
jgi:hypothetical protein